VISTQILVVLELHLIVILPSNENEILIPEAVELEVEIVGVLDQGVDPILVHDEFVLTLVVALLTLAGDADSDLVLSFLLEVVGLGLYFFRY